MASRPTSSLGAQPGLLYGLITFAIVSVASLGLFIFQLTKNKRVQNEWQTAQTRIERYGSPPDYYANEATARRTKVFGVMAEDLQKVAELVTGDKNDVGATVHEKSRQLLEAIKASAGVVDTGDSLMTALAKLANEYSAQRKRSEADAQLITTLQRDRDAMAEQLAAVRQDFEAQMASVGKRLEQVQQEKTDALAQKDAQLREVQAALDASEGQLQTLKREGNTQLRDKDIEIGRLDTLIADLQKQIQALKPGTFDPNAILTKADGRIVRAIPGSDVVYVNVGARDNLRAGMGFEVYSQTLETTGLRGKASLEVVTVMQETAECRVTRRTSSQPILEGDLIVNIAFERNRRPKFVVRGDFDLNYDGVVDYNGLEQVTALVNEWGGQVVDDLNESVDFAVIGTMPGGGTTEGGAPPSAVVRDQLRQRESERGRFKALVEQAQKLFIPVITQNQFLYLAGYAGDTTAVQK